MSEIERGLMRSEAGAWSRVDAIRAQLYIGNHGRDESLMIDELASRFEEWNRCLATLLLHRLERKC